MRAPCAHPSWGIASHLAKRFQKRAGHRRGERKVCENRRTAPATGGTPVVPVRPRRSAALQQRARCPLSQDGSIFWFGLVGDNGPDGGLEEPVRGIADVEGGGHGLRERNGEPVGIEGRIVRAEVDGLVRNRGSVEAGGEGNVARVAARDVHAHERGARHDAVVQDLLGRVVRTRDSERGVGARGFGPNAVRFGARRDGRAGRDRGDRGGED